MSQQDICWNCGLPKHEHRTVLGEDPPVLICPYFLYEPSKANQDRLRAMEHDFGAQPRNVKGKNVDFNSYTVPEPPIRWHVKEPQKSPGGAQEEPEK